MINTVLYNLPPKVHSFARENADGSFTVVINARLSRKCQEAAYLHEMDHINNGDLSNDAPADQIETARH